jgi:hypothetical protein
MHTTSALAIVPQPDVRYSFIRNEHLAFYDYGATVRLLVWSSKSHFVWTYRTSLEAALTTVDQVELITQFADFRACFLGFVHFLYTKASVELGCGGLHFFSLLLVGSFSLCVISSALLFGCVSSGG